MPAVMPALALAQAGVPEPSTAQSTTTTPRENAAVMVECLAALTPLLEEALIRARAEVAAAGLRVVVPDARGPSRPDTPWSRDPAVYGHLAFDQIGSMIRIQALAPGLSEPVVQSIDTEAPGVDAEVIAVRAVETLRAAMVQYASSAEGSRRSVPAAVGRFARVKPKHEAREPARARAPKARPKPSPEGSVEARRGILLNVWLAPEVRVDLKAGEASGGGRVHIYAGTEWVSLGVGGRQVWGLNSIVRDEGSARTRRTDVELSLRAQASVGFSTSVYVAASGGYRQYVIQSSAAPSNTGFDRQHATAAGVLELGAAQWLYDQFGVFLGAGITAAADAPHLYFNGRGVATLDRPSLWVSLGVVAGQH